MRVAVLAVPYDSALRGTRMGAGPEHLLAHGLAERLREAGHDVSVERIEAELAPPAEIRTAFELDRRLAERVRAAVADAAFPLVLSGNCNTALGTLAGLRAGDARTDDARTDDARDDVAVVWLDAHGDFNTPDSSTSGFLDGMAVAAATGRCWAGMAATIPGFRAVPDADVVLVGARDLDPAEAALLAGSGVRHVLPDEVRTVGAAAALAPALAPAAAGAARRARRAYLHVDLDVLDPAEGRANQYAAPGGLTLAEVEDVARAVGGRCRIAAAALTAYDPSYDGDGRVLRAALRLAAAVTAAASSAARGSRRA